METKKYHHSKPRFQKSANHNSTQTSKYPKKIPYLVYSDAEGNLFEDDTLECTGRSGTITHKLTPKDFVELPYGSDFFTLPGRRGVGFDVEQGIFRATDKGNAVAVFVAPAHTQLYTAAYQTDEGAPVLPLFAYTPVGWLDGKFYTTAVRIDPDKRQDCELFDQNQVIKKAEDALAHNPANRLLKHISHCALVYHCPAARNYFLGRWEAPLPTSPTCNSKCMGCISYQPKNTELVSPQNRITFVPTPEEIAEIAIPHLNTAPNPIVSFGQGCEGEPLLVWETIEKAIRLIRKQTKKGVINLNTNGSKPDAVKALCEAGLDSIRISMNSAKEEWYNKYYNPNNYSYADVMESFKVVREYGIWSSVNYFVFPGLTDSLDEIAALKKMIGEYQVNMIQWRNFNIDPEWYLKQLDIVEAPYSMGIKQMMKHIRKEFPHVYYGYFNPGKEIILEMMKGNGQDIS